MNDSDEVVRKLISAAWHALMDASIVLTRCPWEDAGDKVIAIHKALQTLRAVGLVVNDQVADAEPMVDHEWEEVPLADELRGIENRPAIGNIAYYWCGDAGEYWPSSILSVSDNVTGHDEWGYPIQEGWIVAIRIRTGPKAGVLLNVGSECLQVLKAGGHA